MNRLIILTAAFLLLGTAARAQRFSVATNVVDYADFGTLNLEGDVAVGRQWTFVAGAKYNPFLYKADTEPLSARQQLYAAGVRFWPWHVFSGWWLGGKVQYQEYNRGGIRSAETDEGDRYGAGLSAGFSYMLHPHLNVSVGAGVWAGYQRYTLYSCPVCGVTQGSGEKTFILPNDLAVSLSYVF